MARIGDYIQPELGRIDYGPLMAAQSQAYAGIGSGIQNAVGEIGDALKERKEHKDKIKTGKELAKAISTLYPELGVGLEPYVAAMEDEETPLSQRGALAGQIGSLVSLGLDKQKEDTRAAEALRNYMLDVRGEDRADASADRNNRAFDASFDDAQQQRAGDKETRDIVAPALLAQYIQEARTQEEAGGSPLVSSARLQEVLQTGTTEAKMGIASAIESMRPKSKEPTIREVDVTMNGQPTRLPVTWNPSTESFDPIRIGGQGGAPLQGLPSSLAPYAKDFEEAGAQYGVDPKVLAAISMHETGNGTSPAFKNKNNAMGISNSSGATAQPSVRDSIFHMARLLGSTESGPYKNAATVGDVAGIYAPIGAENDPRSLNQHWKSGVSGYLKQLGGDPSAPIRITPGAVTGKQTGKTPAELQKEQLEIQKLQGDVETRKADVAKQTDAKATAKASAEDALDLVGKLRKHPGFENAVGMTYVPGFLPGTDRKGAEAIINQLKGHAFLNAIQQLRGLGALSDAEGKKLEQAAARLSQDQHEKDFKASLDDYENQIHEVLGRLGGNTAPTSPAASYSDRLRNLK